MMRIRIAILAVAGGVVAGSVAATAPVQVALVENVSGNPAGVEFMDYLETGKTIELVRGRQDAARRRPGGPVWGQDFSQRTPGKGRGLGPHPAVHALRQVADRGIDVTRLTVDRAD